MTDRELMQMVLEELEELADVGYGSKTVLEALRERLSQPEPEPVAWFTEDHREDKSATTYSKKMAERWREKGWPVTPLYTAPPSIEAAVLAEREACAKVCDAEATIEGIAQKCAAAIRARGEK